MQNEITAYSNGLYHSKKHHQVFEHTAVCKSLAKRGLNFKIRDKKTGEDVTDKHILLILSKALKRISESGDGVKIQALKKSCIELIKKTEK